jgi:predicted phosphodiesterase
MILLSAALAAPMPASPEDGALLGPDITFTVQAGQTTTVYVRPAIGDAAPFRIVVLPDTQFYTVEANLSANGDLFAAQTEWIANNPDGVAFVTHLGDIVQDWDDVEQWAVADAAMSHLDDVVPYGLVVGNHDYPARHPHKQDQELFNTYFPISRFEGQPWWGAGFPEGTNDSSFQTFSVGGLRFLIFHFKFEPDDAVRDWAAGVIEAYPDHRVIISTHSHLGPDGELWAIPSYDPAQTIWPDLIEPYDNVFMVLSAHVDGEALRTDYVGDRPVHQLLACYQSQRYGGGSRLRLLDFHPEADRIDVSTYMPWGDTWEEDADSTFSLDYEMGALSVVGTGEPAEGLVTVAWSAPGDGDYEWLAETADGQRSALYTLTVDGTAPTLSAVTAEPLAEDGSARISWRTDEPADGIVFIDGAQAGSTVTADVAHAIDLFDLPPEFILRISATDAAGNTASSGDVAVVLYTPQDTAPPDTAPDTAPPEDSGAIDQPPEPGCGGCATGAPGGGFLLLLLLLPLRRARITGSSSVR